MTSQDTLGYGATADFGLGQIATVNVNIRNKDRMPGPSNMKVASIEAGASLPGLCRHKNLYASADRGFLNRFIFHPASRGQDELSPFERSLRSGLATVNQPSHPPVGLLGTPAQSLLGGGMANWSATVGASPAPSADANGSSAGPSSANVAQPSAPVFATRADPIPYLPPAPQDKPGGILGILIDAGHVDPAHPDRPPAGGAFGPIQDYLRNYPGAGR
jgi:hypothetical protein